MKHRDHVVLVIVVCIFALAIVPLPSSSTWLINSNPGDTFRLGRVLEEKEVLTWRFETDNSSRGLDLIIEDGNGTIFFFVENTSASKASFTAPKTDWWYTVIQNPSESLVVNATLDFGPLENPEPELSSEWMFFLSLLPLMAVGIVILVVTLALRHERRKRIS